MTIEDANGEEVADRSDAAGLGSGFETIWGWVREGGVTYVLWWSDAV